MEKASLLLDQARGAYQREQYKIALAYFRRACQVDPASPEALLGVGEVAAYLELRGEAVTAFLTLADVYTQAGMLEVAADVVERVLELDAAQPIARRFQAFIRSRMRRPTGDTGQLLIPPEEPSEVTSLERPSPRPPTGMARLESVVSESELPLWDENEDEVDSRADTRASTQVVNRDLDQVLGELGVSKSPAKGKFAFADTMMARAEARPDSENEASLTDVDPPPRRATTEVGTPPPVFREPESEPTLVDPAKHEGNPDTIKEPSRAEPMAAAAHIPVRSDDAFADISTRAAPDGLMQQLAKARDDAFSAVTRVAAVPELAKLTANPTTPDHDPEPTHLDPPQPTATGSGQHEVDAWDVDTVAAVNAENVRLKPKLSLKRIDWEESDFPKLDEFPDTEVVSRTINLEGEGAAIAIAGLMSVSPLLAPLDAPGVSELISGSEITQTFADQIIVRQDDAGSSLYLLVTGKAAVERTTAQAVRRVASISPGAFFGEGSLLADAPRTATVRIIEDALVLEVGRELIQKLVSQQPRLLTVLTRFLRARLLSALMMDSPLFEQLPLNERANLAPRLHLHKLTPGQVVAERGQVLTGYCTVMTGILRKLGVADGTGSQQLARLGPGTAFGSRSLDDEASPVSIAAETGCWLLRLPTTDLRALVARHPELVEALYETDELSP